MPRKTEEQKHDPQVTEKPTIDMDTVEIRGRGKKWNVYYPDAENIMTPTPVYKDGVLTSVTYSWTSTNDFTKVHETFSSIEEAKEAVRFIKPGATIKVIKTDQVKRKKK